MPAFPLNSIVWHHERSQFRRNFCDVSIFYYPKSWYFECNPWFQKLPQHLQEFQRPYVTNPANQRVLAAQPTRLRESRAKFLRAGGFVRTRWYIGLNSKSAWFCRVTSEFWPLITATSKQNPCADIQDSTRLCWSFSIKQTPTFALYSPLNVHLVFLFIGVVCVFCFAVFLLAPFKQRCKRCTFNNTAFALQELTK